MTSFKQALNMTRTANGMPAYKSTNNALVDLFYSIGSHRDSDITPLFAAAFNKDAILATKIALWARDARQGAGERKTFYTALRYIEKHRPDILEKIIPLLFEIGRSDDVLQVVDLERFAFPIISKLLLEYDHGLVAKWMPRKGPVAKRLRAFLKLTPYQYRKLLVRKTNVVESAMCAKDWANIKYPHVPSKAMSIYATAFRRHDLDRFKEYLASVATGKTKINTAGLYPYEIVHQIKKNFTSSDSHVLQWNSLPNYVGDKLILPMVDVSGSMAVPNNSKSSITNMDIAVSLGLYLSEKNKGKFKDIFMTFSEKPSFVTLEGSIFDRIRNMERSSWGMNTNILSAMELIIKTAIEGNVPPEEMPEYILILSDMQFDSCIKYDAPLYQFIKNGFAHYGYIMPKIVFWNLAGRTKNVPVTVTESNVALISGFSPAIMKSVLSGKEFTPESIMMETINIERYNFNKDV